MSKAVSWLGVRVEAKSRSHPRVEAYFIGKQFQ